MFLWEILDNAAAAVGRRTALIADRRRISFSELAAGSHTLAGRLGELVEPGGRVGIVAANSAAYVASLYGVPRCGAVLVHGNTRHTPEELGAMFDRCGATTLLVDRAQMDRLGSLRSVSELVSLDDLVDWPDDDAPHNEPEASASGHPSPTPAPSPAPADDGALAWLMYTSGTTGAPKGVMLTHRSLVSAALNTTLARPVADDEVYLFPFPLFHVAAYNVIHHHLRQRPVALLGSFDPVAAMEAIETERVTSVSLAPTMLAMLLDHPGRTSHDLSSLRNVSYGAAAMPRELLARSLSQWPEVGLSQGYGMTELSGNAVFLSPEDHRRGAAGDSELLTAAGRPAPMTSLRIVDDHGRDVPTGGTGEIRVRGDQVCAGYFEDPAATDAAITDGWLHTGDLGRIDDRGYLHVVDRLKDIIITGGENVSSREVEDVLGTHPGVRTVAVVGTPDRRWGELVTAVVVPEDPAAPPTVGDLRGVCSALAGFKHPRRVVTIEAMPLNASGKIDKVTLRALVSPTGPT